MQMPKYVVYILQSFKDQKFYIGFSKDIDNRLKQHNNGRVRATKHRIPFKLVYKEYFNELKLAVRREKFLKNASREKICRLIDLVDVAQLG